jgi:RNA polymerase sigma-70 factor (ECF subfamily)
VELAMNLPLPAVAVAKNSGPDLADAHLVERTLAGDDRAFEFLVRAHQQRIFYAVRRIVRRDADAQDVTQQAFIRAHQKLATFRGDSSFRSWLYRIAINLAKNHLRDHRRELPSEMDKHDAGTSAVGLKRVLADEQRTRLQQSIASLPEKQRAIVELRIYDELSFKEIASITDCSVNAAKVNFHHGMKKLRALLSGEE